MFAVIKTGGKQYLIRKGSVLKVEKLDAEVGKVVELNKVICFQSALNEDLSISNSAVVKAEVLEQRRDKKIIIFKKRRRKNYRRKNGHRQYITVLRINEIVL
ncbi:50S ribosomal protein L21 [Wolbachia endosymbiont of Pentidionis agamae]|uniref:50S ribosomal protein L21 n=1 Tax=Wolbachia endosymbiont of Pentidionis agamae TaxID=3110435 RepID=UPI002FD5DA52